jgi:hypothetical protein
MSAALARVVVAETLDGLAEADPDARRSRRDLRRVHRAMGTRGILAEALRDWLSASPAGRPLRVLELGAGDGTLMLGVARTLARNAARVELTLLDRQDLVEPSTRDAYAALGWAAMPRRVDIVDWIATGTEERWDLIVTNLFLHHFEGETLRSLLAACAARTDRFFACEPRRARLALAASHLVGFIGANAVTREDAVLSVHAGFRDAELSALWPNPDCAWRLDEQPAALFSHCLRATRTRGQAANGS